MNLFANPRENYLGKVIDVIRRKLIEPGLRRAKTSNFLSISPNLGKPPWKQACKLQDAQAEKLTSLQANKLTS